MQLLINSTTSVAEPLCQDWAISKEIGVTSKVLPIPEGNFTCTTFFLGSQSDIFSEDFIISNEAIGSFSFLGGCLSRVRLTICWLYVAKRFHEGGAISMGIASLPLGPTRTFP